MNIQSRLTPLHEGAMSLDQRRVLSDILQGPRGNLDGPFLAWIRSPMLADHAQRLGAFCRYHTQLDLRLSELAILLTAAWWQSQAEWQIHEPIARSSGLSDEVIEALRAQYTPAFSRDDEAAVYHLGEELYRTHRVSDMRYQQAVGALGEAAVVELVAIFGYYALVAMTLNVFAVRRDTTASLPFPEP